MNDYDFEGWHSTFAHCEICGHTWVAVVPDCCLAALECPACGNQAGEQVCSS